MLQLLYIIELPEKNRTPPPLPQKIQNSPIVSKIQNWF